MKEFMTEVPEYIGENENGDERNNNIMIIYVLGAVVLAVCALCLLMLWRKIADRNKTVLKAEIYTEAADTVLSGDPEDYLSKLQQTDSEDTYGITVSEYAKEDAAKQQYLTNTGYLREKVESLLKSMSNTKKALEEALKSQEANAELKEQVGEITNVIDALTLQLYNTQNRILELEESISVMNNETTLTIQESIGEIENQISAMDSNFSDINIKINALKMTDAELKKKMDEIENTMKTYAEQNTTDVENRFDSMGDKMQQIEAQLLRYRYDAESNTLYLYPN